jgi:glycosyltransferase involved in cell wall biosynthesis
MRASIVIPAYNAEKTLGRVLEACLSQDYPKENLEVILVDDGSVDRSSEIAKSYESNALKYIYQDNGGPAKARNTGWKASNGEIICFTDADCVPEKGWVAKLVASYSSPEIGGVGGSYDIVNGDKLLPACIHEEIRERHLRMPKVVNYLGSFNLSYRRNVLAEVGGFDESFTHASGEDNDLSYRIIQKGYTLLFNEHAKVAHCYPENLFNYLKQQLVHGYWRVKLHRIHPKMVKGDVYSGVFDYIQPPLFLVTLLFFPVIFITPFNVLFFLLLLAELLLQLPFSLRVVMRKGEKKYLFLIPVTFLRGFYRSVGLLLGVVRFGFNYSSQRPRR